MSDASVSPLTCVFWNIQKNDRTDLICDLVLERDADVIILAENAAENTYVLEQLKSRVDENFFEPISEIKKLCLFAKTPALDLSEVHADLSGRVTVRRFQFDQSAFLLVAVHLPSKVNWDENDQAAEAAVIADEIRQAEEREGHLRTILMGDLNMNPFEKGIVQASGLHGVPTKSIARTQSRTVQGRTYPFFYNPMWGFFGDQTDGPPGTLYFRKSSHLSYEWNILDQVLFRPDVLDWFDDTIDIVTQIGDTNLLTKNGRPNKKVGSDHLPILFRLSSKN